MFTKYNSDIRGISADTGCVRRACLGRRLSTYLSVAPLPVFYPGVSFLQDRLPCRPPPWCSPLTGEAQTCTAICSPPISSFTGHLRMEMCSPNSEHQSPRLRQHSQLWWCGPWPTLGSNAKEKDRWMNGRKQQTGDVLIKATMVCHGTTNLQSNVSSQDHFESHLGSSHCGAGEMNLTSIHEDAGSTSGLAWWVKDPVLLQAVV